MTLTDDHPRAGIDYPRHWHELLAWFPDNAACLRYLERLRWGRNFACRLCGAVDGGWWQMGDRLRRCTLCRSETSVTAGTIFAGTRTPLVSWVRGDLVRGQPEAGRLGPGASASARAWQLRDSLDVAAQAPPRDGAPRSRAARWRRRDRRNLCRGAAYELRPEYDQTARTDGFISFECTPDLADDTNATIAQAIDLWQRIDRPNAMIKVPGTEAGLPAIEELTRRGVNVNITLLFSVERYEQVIDAYVSGLRARFRAGEPLDSIMSVASFFLSRIDTKVDAQLPEESPLRGTVALASARVAYQRYLAKFAGPEWERLERAGARRQRPLWASTGTKNPAYSDVLYVSELIGPDVVNTMPEQTLRAFADHGEVRRTVDADTDAVEETLAQAQAAEIDLAAVTAELEREGVQSFCDSYHQLRECIESKLGVMAEAGG